jgi:hypothetical protein
MPINRQLTVAEAKALAASWESQTEQFREDGAFGARFRDASPLAVISMWETGTNEDGKRLARFSAKR